MTGETLGPFRLDRELGSGGMGRVYAATVVGRCPGLHAGAIVALKVVHQHLTSDGDALARFRREAAVGVSVRHPNVVVTLAAGEADERHWLALEYVNGQTLHALRAELGIVPEKLCRHVAHEVAAGLAAMHAAGIVHRDLKPENVLITREHAVKVMDLGVARGAEDDSRLTQTGAFIGSLQYAAPEQFTGGGKGIDGRADLHALGALLYELATGANPYEDTDWRVVFQRVLKETPRRLGAVNPQISPFFEEVVHTLLAKDRNERFASAAELASVLEAGEDSPWWTARARAIRGATRRPLRRVRIPRETALVGRDAEMAALRAAFEKAKAGEGCVVLVEGEAGIGKSRLVDEFVALLEREGEDLDFLYGSYPPGGAATASGAFTTAYREHFGSEDLEATLRGVLAETPLLVPGFAALLTNQAPPAGALALTKDSLQACFGEATRFIAARRVAIVLIDDLHFAPDEGRALFASLATAAADRRILLVGTSRPPLDERWAAGIARASGATRIAVGRLGARDLVALLKDSLRSSHLAAELSLRIAEKTDGNPFFVFEVLRGLRDGKYLTQRPDGTWATTRVIGEIRIPASIADMVQARVGDLSEDERNLLEVAACIGFEFDPALAAAACGTALLPTLRAFGQIEKTHGLVRSAGRAYRFDHHQVQEHLYAGLHEQVREQLHAAIAGAVEARTGAAAKEIAALDGRLAVELCEHLLRGGEGARALRYLDAAHLHLASTYLNDAAIRLVERALATPGLVAGAARAKLLMDLCRVDGPLDRLGRRTRQEEGAREALRLAEAAGDAGLMDLGETVLGWTLSRSGRLDEAGACYRRALERTRARGDLRLESVAAVGLGVVHHARREYPAAQAHAERAVAIARERGDRGAEVRAWSNLAEAQRCQGRLAEAMEGQRRVLELLREAPDRQVEARAVLNLGIVLGTQHRIAEAQDHYERALLASREIGDRQTETWATLNLGNLMLERGRVGEAIEHLEHGISMQREIGDPRGEAFALYNLGDVFRWTGEPASAKEHYLAAIRLFEAVGFPNMATLMRLWIGSVERETGHADAARASLGRALDEAAASGDRNVETLVRCEMACLPGGDIAGAELALRENAERIDPARRRTAHWLLWQAGRDERHLREARRLVDESLAGMSPEQRAAAIATFVEHRRILAACGEPGG